MVQVLQDPRKERFSNLIAGNLGESLGQGLGQGVQISQALAQEARKAQMQKELARQKMLQEFSSREHEYGLRETKGAQDFGRQLGLEREKSNLRREENRLSGEQKFANEQEKKFYEQIVNQVSDEVIEKQFGKDFADIYTVAPIGGKTELLKHAIDAKLRGQNIKDILSTSPENTPTKSDTGSGIPLPKMVNGKVEKDAKWPELSSRPEGYTPKDWIKERQEWSRLNAPIFSENRQKLKNIQRDILGTKKLTQLNESKKLPEGFERSLINPETNNFYGLAQLAGVATPEAQEWVKEIARFQNRAKDAFGSRVTNFDLESYMKQFPGLLNTYEGRKRILNMMNLNYKMDEMYENALKNVYNHYKLSGISPVDADNIAQEMISGDIQNLEDDFLSLHDQESETKEAAPALSGKFIDVMSPDGEVFEIDESELNSLPSGWKRA